MIYIGCDTHKQTHTLVALNESGRTISSKKIHNTLASFEELMNWDILKGNNRLWSIENSQHDGKHLAQYLIEKGEKAYEISPKLTAQLRGRSLKQDKSDKQDALAIAKALFQEKENLHLIPDKHSDDEALKELTRLRDSLVRKRTDLSNLLHKSLFKLDPDYTKNVGDLRSKKSVATVKRLYIKKYDSPLDHIYQTEIQILLNLLSELDGHIQKLEKEFLRNLLSKVNSPLSSLEGVGHITESVLLGEIGDISRYQNAAQLASRAGLSPLENSSASNRYRRVNPGGNRRINCAFHIIALSQIRNKNEGYTYYMKKKMEGKTSKEAIKCLKRKLADIVYSMLKNKAVYLNPIKAQKAA